VGISGQGHLEAGRVDLSGRFTSSNPRRRELRERFTDAALTLARDAVERGDFEAAIDATRRLLRVEPGEEQAHYLLVRALSGSGRTLDALCRLEICARSLRETRSRGCGLRPLRSVRSPSHCG
jgi:DNA-binding SARP family transcriptional activator